MPFHLVFHEAHAFALDCPRDQAFRPVTFESGKRSGQIIEVMAVRLRASEPEGLELPLEWLQVHDFLRVSESLQPIGIDNHSQVSKPMMPGKKSRFPDGPFVAFSV